MKLFTIWTIYILALWFFSGCMVGDRGTPGKDGIAGPPGTSCSVNQLANGAEIICGDQTSAIILNGEVGPKGEDMVPGPYAVLELVNPCGKQGSHDEVLLRFGTGQLLAHYSHGDKQFFTIVGPGSYQTTDGTNCNFSITQDLEVTW